MKPDFLCIGGQKAGTTWLYQKLRQHPEIWLPPVKEVHYFDSLRLPLRKRLQASLPHRYRKDKLRKFWFQPKYWKFLTVPLWDSWYLSLFQEARGLTSGDITPGYSILRGEEVGRVHRLLPAAKVIVLLREPVSRAWSQIRHDVKNFNVQMDSLERMRPYLNRPSFRERSHYPQILESWERVYPSEQMAHFFFDDLAQRPDWFLARVCEFLGVDPSFRFSGLHEKIHQGLALDCPVWLHEELRAILQEDRVWLANRFGGHASQWLQVPTSL
ncbi:MAG: sulfotransferase [Candidatus Eremiobacteraeota bacterium]|mgnify:CR=1 FL=1|nr:sulfotransferase [Candidatus Eremiobacteraeota bacterium]